MRVIEIQDITLDYTRRGITQKYCYENVIFSKYYISYSCFCRYLSINAKVQLKKLRERKTAKNGDLTLF